MERRLSLTQMKKDRYARISLIGGLAGRVMKDGMQTSFCKENYLKMKLRYRIKIAFLKWRDKMHDRRIERQNRRLLINSILFDKIKGTKIKRYCRVNTIEDYEYIFKKIGLDYTITKDKKEGVDVIQEV